MKVSVDSGERTHLGLCGCGARFLALSRERALERLVTHEERAHPGDQEARERLRLHRARHAAPAPAGARGSS